MGDLDDDESLPNFQSMRQEAKEGNGMALAVGSKCDSLGGRCQIVELGQRIQWHNRQRCLPRRSRFGDVPRWKKVVGMMADPAEIAGETWTLEHRRVDMRGLARPNSGQ